MRTLLALASSLAALAAAHPAHAAPAPDDPPPRLWASGRVEFLSAGAITSAPGTGTQDVVDAADATAVSTSIDFAPRRALSIGLGLRVIANVKPSDGLESATQVDILLRVAVSKEVAPATRLFAVVAPGWSSMYVPFKLNKDLSGPRGPILELGGGVARALGPRFAVTAEAGYLHGLQEIVGGGVTAPLHDHFLRVALGVAVALD